MTLPGFSKKNEYDPKDKRSLELEIRANNFRNAKVMAIVVIAIEVLFSLIDVIAAFFKADSRFDFNGYLLMYLIMILINVLLLLFLRSLKSRSGYSVRQGNIAKDLIVVYVTLIMLWGSVVSLIDQKLYGQLMTFMINMFACSIIFILDSKKILISYTISGFVLVAGLPFFQKSRDVLIGHYANLFVFLIISWIASRIIYHNYCENYISKIRLRQSNQLLKNKIEENRQINFRLSIANNQLMDLALLDELTGIPNRRSFRRFIDRSFDCVTQGVLFSVIMVDIDLFKQFNDHYGHEEGDKILVAVAKLLNSIVENPDEIVVRWGGEEFVYASFHKTQEDITAIAVLIKEKLRDLHLQHEESPNHYVTASLGTSTIPAQSKKDVSKAVALADRAMYMAKSSGRNCLKSLNDVSELRPDFALAVREGNRN